MQIIHEDSLEICDREPLVFVDKISYTGGILESDWNTVWNLEFLI
jgi:hypothetical protein